MTNVPQPSYGDIWYLDFDPVIGHEQAGRRPGVVVSHDMFNHGPAGIVVVVPLTTRQREVPMRVPVDPPEGGLKHRSFVKCEDVRSVSTQRLIQRWGKLTDRRMADVAYMLRTLLNL